MARPRCLLVLAALLALTLGVTIARSQGPGTTISECTPAAVEAALAAGGEWTFGCSGRINVNRSGEGAGEEAGIEIANDVTLDAADHDVTFGPPSGAGSYGNRLFHVLAGGSLTLKGIDIERYAAHGTFGAPGKDGTDGWKLPRDFYAPGPDGLNDSTAATPPGAARGGCFLVEPGGRLELQGLAVRQCTAIARDGNRGGKGGGGANGGSGEDWYNPYQDGGAGHNGGNGQRGADGAAGGDARGGAIFSEGTLVLRTVELVQNEATAGRGGDGGAGGQAGGGGQGGKGGAGYGWIEEQNCYCYGDGGDGGPSGTPGTSAPGGRAAAGGAAEGGAVYASGSASITGARLERNVARAGDGGVGGDGGNGGSTYWSQGGNATEAFGYEDGENTDPASASAGADGGDNGAGGDAKGGAVLLVGDQPEPVNVINEENKVIGGVGGGKVCDPPDRAPDCADGGFGGIRSTYSCSRNADGTPRNPHTCSYAADGRDGAAAGDGAGSDPDLEGASGEAPFDVAKFGPGEFKLDSRLEVPEGDQPLRYSWDFGDGRTGGIGKVENVTYDEPGSYTITHEARDVHDNVYRSTRVVEVEAPELGIAIRLDQDVVDVDRMPLDRPVDVTVRVSADCEGVGDLRNLRFDEGVVLEGRPAERVALTGLEPPDGPFDLEPCTHRDFSGQVTGTARGDIDLSTGVAGVDGTGEAVAREANRALRVGNDLEVTVTATPAELELDVDEEADPPRPVPEQVTLAVAVHNVSGEAVEDATLDLRPAVRTLTGRNPSAPFPLQVTTLKGRDGNPDTALTNDTAQDIEVGDLINDSTKTMTFVAEARDKAIVDVRAIARGATASTPAREVSGAGEGEVRIGQPRVLALTADGPAHQAVKAGGRWTFDGEVENLSPDQDVTVFVRAHRRENVVEGQIGELGTPDVCGCGVIRRLEPGERLPLYATMTSRADGSTRGTVDIEVKGWTHSVDETGAEVETPVSEDDIVVAPGADRRTVSIDLTEPLNDPFNLFEAAWIFEDSAARAFGQVLTGSYDAAQTFLATPKSVYLQQALVLVREEVPEAVARAKSELAFTLVELNRNLTQGEALAIADEALTRGMVQTSEAWEDATWQGMAQTSGTLVGALAPELALEAALPALGACKLLKYGGKTAMLRKAEKLGASRAGRLLGKGRKGLVPGDEVSSLLARKFWGVDGLIDSQLMRYAQAKKVIIAVRDRSPGSIRRLTEGMLPKWEKVKAKNVSQLDVDFLGFAPDHLDTAMLKQMPEWSVVQGRLAGRSEDVKAMVEARWKQRKKEWEEGDREAMEAYERGGNIPAPSKEFGLNPTDNGAPHAEGVWVDNRFQLGRAGQGDVAATTDGLPAYQPQAFKDGRFRAMTGDMDPIAVLDENGQIPSLARRLEIYRDLAEMGFQHPESLTWDNPAGREKYLRDFDLANADADALLAYTPDGTRRAVYFDSRKSAFEQGAMALIGMDIAFEGAEIVAGDVPLERPPATEVPPYINPGGEEGAILSDAPGTPMIRRNLDGTFSRWTRERGWERYELPAGRTVTTTPQTAVRSASAAGETRIDINEQNALILKPGDQAWFKPGDLVVIDPGGPNEEFVTVAALGSIITTEPLTKDHRIGEMVPVVPRAPGAAPNLPAASLPGPGDRAAALGSRPPHGGGGDSTGARMRFTLRARLDRSRGTARLTVVAPVPGIAVMRGRGVARRRATLRPPRPRGRRAAPVYAASMLVRPGRGPRRRLRRTGRARVDVSVTVIARAGGRSTLTRKVTLRQRR